MTAQTTMSPKGQVVIPKDVRDRYRFDVGERLDVVERPDGVLLRRRTNKSGETFEEIAARIRNRITYAGPPVTLDEMDQAIADMWAREGPEYD